MIETEYALATLSSISQVVATIMSIYLAVLTFTLGYFWRDKEYKRNTINVRRKIILGVVGVSAFIIILTLIFFFPSSELGMWKYGLLALVIIYNYFNIRFFLKSKNPTNLETGVAIFSVIFAILSFIIGFYLVFSSISGLPSIDILDSEYIFNLVKITRLFLVLTLISFINLISFIIVHRITMIKNS